MKDEAAKAAEEVQAQITALTGEKDELAKQVETLTAEKQEVQQRINCLREACIDLQKRYQETVKISQIAEMLDSTGVGITAGPPYELIVD